jgi:hypothetical protein
VFRQEAKEGTVRCGPTDDPLGCVDVSLAVGVDVDDGQSAQLDDEILLQALHLFVRLPSGLRVVVPDHDQIRHLLAPPSVVRGPAVPVATTSRPTVASYRECQRLHAYRREAARPSDGPLQCVPARGRRQAMTASPA